MTKKDNAILAELDNLWNCAKIRTEHLMACEQTDTIRGMIERNKGYMMAIEDAVSVIHNYKPKNS